MKNNNTNGVLTRECPICKSQCFADMKMCYGCMHQFKQEMPDVLLAETIQKPSGSSLTLPSLLSENTEDSVMQNSIKCESKIDKELTEEKENRAKHRAHTAEQIKSQKEAQETPQVQAEYKLVISLIPESSELTTSVQAVPQIT